MEDRGGGRGEVGDRGGERGEVGDSGVGRGNMGGGRGREKWMTEEEDTRKRGRGKIEQSETRRERRSMRLPIS